RGAARPQTRDHRVVREEQRRQDTIQRWITLGRTTRRSGRVVRNAGPLGHDELRERAPASHRTGGKGISPERGSRGLSRRQQKDSQIPFDRQNLFTQRAATQGWGDLQES